MPRITVRDKTVNPNTGDIELSKKFFYIDRVGPNASIEYHKLADLLQVDRFARLDPHVSERLTLLYNWAARSVRSNDVEKICQHIDGQRKILGLPMLGVELVKTLYRKARFDMEDADNKAKLEMGADGRARVDRHLELDHQKALELKRQANRQGRQYKKGLEDTEQMAEVLATKKANEMPKNDMSVNVVKYKVVKYGDDREGV